MLTLACHEMMLRLAGKAPDDLAAQCRGWLADGEFEALARAISFFAVANNVPLTSFDLGLLANVLEDSDADPGKLTEIQIDDSDPMPFYGFAAELPDEFVPVKTGSSTGPDKAEQALVKAVAAEAGAIGAWRAWRFPADGSPWPPPKRVFTIEVSHGTDQAAVTALLQQKLSSAKESTPQVEVYETGGELPIYQRLARGYGELIWAVAEDPGIQVAGVFDSVDAETGPHFNPDHAKLDDDEAAKVADYLYAGEPLLVTTATMDDIIDTERTSSVPMSFRTDGTWIWADASSYYVAEHHLEPDAGLLAHIRSAAHAFPTVDGVAAHRAFAVLQTPSEEEPVWTVGDSPGAVGSAETD
jgi:hypothetical protein